MTNTTTNEQYYTRRFTSMGDKPVVRLLIDQLLAEGYEFERPACEWVKGDDRGRICCAADDRTAWLTRPHRRGNFHEVTL